MNKTQLIDAVASQLDITKAKASSTLDTVFGILSSAVVSDGEVVLPNFGKLKMTAVKETKGVAMGKHWSKPAHKKVKLKLSTDGELLGN